MPPQSPKGEVDYVLLGLATNSRIVFLVKNSVCSPLYWRGVGGEAFHEMMTFLFHKSHFYILHWIFYILHFYKLNLKHKFTTLPSIGAHNALNCGFEIEPVYKASFLL